MTREEYRIFQQNGSQSRNNSDQKTQYKNQPLQGNIFRNPPNGSDMGNFSAIHRNVLKRREPDTQVSHREIFYKSSISDVNLRVEL